MKRSNIQSAIACTFFAVALSMTHSALAAAIAHWSFDETSGTTVSDDVGGANGTQNGGTINLNAAGRFNTGADFPGSAWYNTPNVTGWRTNDFTVASWVKLDSTAGNQAVFSKWWNPWEFRFEVGNGGASDLRNASNTTFVGGGTSVGDTNWHHVAWAWDKSAGTMKFYKDGYLNKTLNGTPNQNVRNTSSQLNIGRKGDSSLNIDGTLDELWVYDEALNIDQINGLKANNELPGSTRVVTGATKWLDIIGGNETQNTWTEQVTLADVNGHSVTLDITLTNAASEVFSRRDGNQRFAVGVGGDGNGVGTDEDPTLTVSLVSSTSLIDPNSIGFNITDMGLRSLSGAGVGDWTSSVTTAALTVGGNGSDLAIPLDDVSLFHLLNGSSYTGTLDVTDGFFQLTDISLIDGLQYSVSFNVIPEPSCFGLAAFGMLSLGFVRFRHGAGSSP